MAEAKKIVKVRKDASGKITHVVYSDGTAETIKQAVKRAQKGGVANFDGVVPKTGQPYLRKKAGQKKSLAELPVEKSASGGRKCGKKKSK